MKIIPNSRDLVVLNLAQLPRGTGARYLECIDGPNGSYIAKQWRRTPPKQYETIIDLDSRNYA